jgi:hypothetical protein
VYYALVIVFLACRTLWDVHKMKKSIGAIGTANQLSKRDKQLRKVAFHVIIVAMAALFGLVVVAIGVANDQLWTNFIYSRWLKIFFLGSLIPLLTCLPILFVFRPRFACKTRKHCQGKAEPELAATTSTTRQQSEDTGSIEEMFDLNCVDVK